MKFRMITFVLIFALAAWLPVIAQESTLPQPTTQHAPAAGTPSDSGKAASNSACTCCNHTKAQDKQAAPDQTCKTCCAGKDSKSAKANCCTGKEMACCQKNATGNQTSAQCCSCKDGKMCATKDCSHCCGNNASACAGTDGKNCCAGHGQGCCHGTSQS